MAVVEKRVTGARVYGRNPVLALLRGGGRRAEEVAVLAGGRGPLTEVVALARQAGVKVSYRSRDQLTVMAGTAHHQGVVCRVAEKAYAELDELLPLPGERGQPAFFLALDGVHDPQNLGALLRTADATGVHGVVVPRHRAVGLTGATAKAAMGAVESVSVARVTNLAAMLARIKHEGVWVYGAVSAGGVRAWEADLTRPLCLVLGGEGGGLRPLTVRSCDLLVSLPMQGRVGSLNVGAAAAALCYEVVRQRALKFSS